MRKREPSLVWSRVGRLEQLLLGRSRTRRTGSSERKALVLVRRPEQLPEQRLALRRVRRSEPLRLRGSEVMRVRESVEKLLEMRWVLS